MKGMVIAGTGSGSGKTTMALGLMACLNNRGYRVAPFKVGPDFIDPGHHTALIGTPSRNLDSWMLNRQVNRRIFERGCTDRDVAVVEGVMGLFDGYSGVSEAGSTAQMAKWLNLPVILLVNAASMARSAAAIVKGFEVFDPDLSFAGVIFMRTGSARHYDYLKEAVADRCTISCLGHLPRNETLTIPERHLGLVTADEHAVSDMVTDTLVPLMEQHIDIDGLLARCDLIKSNIGSVAGNHRSNHISEDRMDIADGTVPTTDQGGVSENPLKPSPSGTVVSRETYAPAAGSAPAGVLFPEIEHTIKRQPEITIAVARDKAFCFYYPENLELLQEAGARLVYFSPMSDPHLPQGIHGIYFGGGYPELFSRELSRNTGLLKQVREKSRAGMPIYGECGGFMYLCRNITDMDGNTRSMTGCFPFTAVMSKKMRSLGYREIRLRKENLIGGAGEILRGHEFHYSTLAKEELPSEADSSLQGIEQLYETTARAGQAVSLSGYRKNNTLGSYMHVHFGSHSGAALQFAAWCRKQAQKGKEAPRS